MDLTDHTYAQCPDIMHNTSKRPESRRRDWDFFRDSVPGRDHQFHRDYRPGFADRTECYTRNFIDFYCKLTVYFSKKIKKF